MRKGWTLLEILVVLAMMSLLLAILWPILSQARKKAYQASCQSNLHQLGRAFQMFILDHDGLYPDSGNYGQDPDHAWVRVEKEYRIDLRGVLFSYVRHAGVYRCLADGSGKALSFAMNDMLSKYPDSGITYPAETVLLLEEGDRDARGFGLQDGAFDPGNGLDFPSRRHFDGFDLLYCDGHVKWRRTESLLRKNFFPNRQDSLDN